MADQNTITNTKLQAILSIATEIQARLNDAPFSFASLPEDARRAAQARATAHTRGFYLVPEFAAVIGRHNQYVSDRCAAKAIRVLPGGKPFRIPLSEEVVWNNAPE